MTSRKQSLCGIGCTAQADRTSDASEGQTTNTTGGFSFEQKQAKMSRKRIYWVKMNLDEARESIEVMDDAEVGRWLRSWIIGAGGKDIPSDRLQSWSLEQRAGYAAGLLSRADANKFSEDQRNRVSKRYQNKLPECTAVTFGNDSVTETATGLVPTNNEQRTTNNEQKAENNNNPPKPPKGRTSFDPREFDSMIPARIYSEESIEAWHQYVEHRRGKRAKLTELAVNLILKEFATSTPKAFSEALRTSVANGWTGVFLGGSRPQAQQITMHPTANRPLRPDEMP